MKVSIIIPAYNERDTIRKILRLVKAAPLPKGVTREIIVVDDGSKDGTRDILRTIKGIRVVLHKRNRGKGGAIKTGFAAAKGDILIVQDADLEYDPRDYSKLIRPILSGKARVVYGSRILGRDRKKTSSLIFYMGGRVVTIMTNILFLSRLTDEPTCYKVFHKSVLKEFRIHGERFDWEPEVTAKILKRGIRIHEVPIRYYPRSHDEGKKINWRDGVQAIWTLFKYRFTE